MLFKISMSKIHQKIELIANILIIVAVIGIGGILIQKYFFAVPTNQQVRVQPTVGAEVNLSNVNWEQQPKTLVLVLQTGCHFCNESAPFYKRIIESVQNKNVKLIAVFPTDSEKSKIHLNDLGINNIEVRRSSLEGLQVSGTPTLILVNEKGKVMDYWVGKLSPTKEDEVINKLST